LKGRKRRGTRDVGEAGCRASRANAMAGKKGTGSKAAEKGGARNIARRASRAGRATKKPRASSTKGQLA
jgi:hypothetical protein